MATLGRHMEPSPKARERHPLQARLTDEAFAAIDRYCSKHHISYTTFVEALGRAMARGWSPPKRIAEEAQELDEVRFTRRRRG